MSGGSKKQPRSKTEGVSLTKAEEQIRLLTMIVNEHQLDSIEAFGIKITKSRHVSPLAPEPKQQEAFQPLPDPDQLLAWSLENAGRY